MIACFVLKSCYGFLICGIKVVQQNCWRESQPLSERKLGGRRAAPPAHRVCSACSEHCTSCHFFPPSPPPVTCWHPRPTK